MGIKLPWFRARMNVKDEVQLKNAQLVGTYSYKFDSYFDSNANSKPIAHDAAEKQDKAKHVLKDKKNSGLKNKTAEKAKSKSVPNSIKKISEKQSSQEHKTNKVSNVQDKNTTKAINKRPGKKPKKAVGEGPGQLFLPTTEEGLQDTTSNHINNEYSPMNKDEEKLQPEVGKTHSEINAKKKSNACDATANENQKNIISDKESGISLQNNPSQRSNEEAQKTLRERRIPESDLGQLTIIIPDSSDEFDEEDFRSPVPDDFHAYDEFDT